MNLNVYLKPSLYCPEAVFSDSIKTPPKLVETVYFNAIHWWTAEGMRWENTVVRVFSDTRWLTLGAGGRAFKSCHPDFSKSVLFLNYLGVYDSPESHERYEPLVARWLCGNLHADRESLSMARVAILCIDHCRLRLNEPRHFSSQERTTAIGCDGSSGSSTGTARR